ncbi:hypothetical protein ACHAXA_007554 [Cyclostephanos tholiformis]|uniref:Uncharacterized protein n=1 Tax=Cyclostephanos tholiformis TaxID=382380 RepID=A0ABD3SS41_9STRA
MGDGGIEEEDPDDDDDDENEDDDDDDGNDDENSSPSEGDGDPEDERAKDDDGLCEYERLRLERIARNNARLAMLGFDDSSGMKKVKRRSAPARPRRSIGLDGPRRQNPDRERRATTFNESELLIEIGLKRKGRGGASSSAASSSSSPPSAAAAAAAVGGTATAGRKRRCGKCDGCARDVNCLTCVACVTGKTRCIFRKCQWYGKAVDRADDDGDAAHDDGGEEDVEEEEEEEDRHDTECYVCNDGGDLICCDGCERAYHSNCHKPKIWDLPDGVWYCMICTSARRALEREDAKVKQPRYSGPLIANLGHCEVNCTVLFPKFECIVCEVTEVSGAFRPPDWVTCRECDDSYHTKCLDPPLENNTWRKWRCITCNGENKKANMKNKPKVKKEKVKKESKPLFEGEHMDDCFMCFNGGDLICCDYCEKAYHLECHIPPLTEVPNGLWKCQECAAVEYTRMMKCGECRACLREDCGKCSNCLDKPKFGGPNKLKQVCLEEMSLFAFRASGKGGY